MENPIPDLTFSKMTLGSVRADIFLLPFMPTFLLQFFHVILKSVIFFVISDLNLVNNALRISFSTIVEPESRNPHIISE